MDDRSKVGQPDRSRINLDEPYEVKYWTQTLGVTDAELASAVKAVGSSVNKVKAHLKEQAASGTTR